METIPGNENIILFDGECNFCNGSVNFVMNRDKKNVFRFGSIQSDAAKILIEKYKLKRDEMLSVVFIEDDKAYVRSTAALRITRKMNGLYPLLYAFIIVPRFIRDAAYDVFARNRYKWFGKRDTCRIPTAEEKGKFI